MHALFNFRTDSLLSKTQTIVTLQANPDFRRNTEVLAEPKRRIGGDGSLSIDDCANAPGGTAMSRASRLMLNC